MGDSLSVVLFVDEDILQLELGWSDLVPNSLPSFNLVHRTHHRKEVSRIQGVPANSRQVRP